MNKKVVLERLNEMLVELDVDKEVVKGRLVGMLKELLEEKGLDSELLCVECGGYGFDCVCVCDDGEEV